MKKITLIFLLAVLLLSGCVLEPPPQTPAVADTPTPVIPTTVELTAEATETELAPTTEAQEPGNLYAYVKDLGIYIFNPATNEVKPLEREALGVPADGLFFSPRLSLDGRYIAFESSYGNSFMIYSLEENHKVVEIIKDSREDITGATILGWGENKRLYYTAMIGDCVFEPELKGPEKMEVRSYSPDDGSSRYEFDLPKVNEAPHAYSIGIFIDSAGKYVMAWNGACSTGLGSRFLLNVESGAVEMDPTSWPASFGDVNGFASSFPSAVYSFGAEGGKLFVEKDPELEWDPDAKLLYLPAGASEAIVVDQGSITEIVTQRPAK